MIDAWRTSRRLDTASLVVLCVLLFSSLSSAQVPPPAPTQVPDWEVFANKGCAGCHRIRGFGEGTTGPDLGRIASGTGFIEIAAAMWNHEAQTRGEHRRDVSVYRVRQPDANWDLMLEFMNVKDGGEWASLPAVGVYSKDFRLLCRYLEYPAMYHKDRLRGHMQTARAGESKEQARERYTREFAALQASPFFDVWASAMVDEILSALHEELLV
jgi:hypothetical protein